MKGPPTRARRSSAPRRDAASKERERIRQLVHDLNTPLSALALQLFLRRRSQADATPQDLRFLEILDRNVERIRTIVASLAPPTPAAEAAPPIRPRRRATSTW